MFMYLFISVYVCMGGYKCMCVQLHVEVRYYFSVCLCERETDRLTLNPELADSVRSDGQRSPGHYKVSPWTWSSGRSDGQRAPGDPELHRSF